MSLAPRSRRVAAGITLALVAALAATNPLAGSADAANPSGSLVELFSESPTFTADPTNAIASGWWGHEGGTGPAGSGPSILSLAGVDNTGTITDASQAALLAALGTDNFDDIGYAVVPYTANGSNERPAISAGENAAEAFGWVVNGASGWGASLNGSSAANDSVTKVSTLAQLTAWVNAGRPLQGFDSNLVLHDISDPTNPVSAAPQGTSILKAWPAGTQLSLVAFVTTGSYDADLQNEVPLVEADGTGHAKTAWMPFTTVASPTSGVRTSAGYQIIGAYAPSITRTQAYSATGATLTGTVKNNANATATNASGNLEFAEVVGGVRSGTTTLEPTVNGVASLSIPGFTSGTRVYDVRYLPDGAAAGTFTTTDWFRTTMTAATPTTTKITVVGGTTDTITAVGAPGVPGSISFFDYTSKYGQKYLATKSAPSGKATLAKKLTPGKHILSAYFTPTSSSYVKSKGVKTIWQPTVTNRLSVTTVRAGTTPKLVVTVVATGATVTGKVTIVFDPPSGPTKTLSGYLSGGKKTFLLPKVVKGYTKVTIKYGGNSQILALTQSMIFKVV